MDKLSPELRSMITKHLFKPDMTLDEAKLLCEELMAERRVKSDDLDEAYLSGDFDLCE